MSRVVDSRENAKKSQTFVDQSHDDKQEDSRTSCSTSITKRRHPALAWLHQAIRPNHHRKALPIFQHLEYAVSILQQNQQSLSLAIEALTYHIQRTISTSTTTQQKNIIMQELFQHLLRIQDGLILCISGEVRHNITKNRPKNSSRCTDKYASRLAQKATASRDGYTQTYKSNCLYNGASWDEIMNPQVGILQRLAQACNYLSWEDFLQGKEEDNPFEDQIILPLEMKMQELQSSIQQLHNHVRQCFFKSVVSLKMVDKLETMTVSIDSKIITFQRRGKQFQISNGEVLPPNLSLQHWKELLAFSDTTKKRRIIHESDDDEENHHSHANPKKVKTNTQTFSNSSGAAASGLIVQTVHKRKDDASNSNTSSIRQIKQDMGMNIQQIEDNHQHLLDEEEKATREAQRIDQQHEDEYLQEEALLEDLLHYRIPQQRKVWYKLQATANDQWRIWDTQETLREMYMEAGNLLLWMKNNIQDRGSSIQVEEKWISRSVDHFEQACALVLRQESLLDEMHGTNKTAKDAEGSTTNSVPPSLRRSLLLLQGQALANKGIALVELFRCRDAQGRRRKNLYLLNDALESFRFGLNYTAFLTKEAVRDSDEDSIIDVLQSMKLASLIRRWKGTALWLQGKYSKAQDIFVESATVYKEFEDLMQSATETTYVDLVLEVYVECYHGAVVLADLGASLLDSLPLSKKVLGDCILQYFETGCSEACEVLRLLNSVLTATDRVKDDFNSDNGIQTCEEIKEYQGFMSQWWKSRSTSEETSIQVDNRNLQDRMVRSELYGEGAGDHSRIPDRIFTIQEGSKRRIGKKKSDRSGLSKDGTSGQRSSVDIQVPSQRRRFRRWGDDFLPKIKDKRTGRMIPKLSYPVIAPEMPPEIASLVAAVRQE